MKSWLCPIYYSCSFRNQGFCGHAKERPIVFSYHPHEQGLYECYIAHVIYCWRVWEKLKERWLESLKRLMAARRFGIREEDLRFALDFMIIHHDIGKLTLEYQGNDVQSFRRHELISAYLLYHCLYKWSEGRTPMRDLLASLFSSAVYLHHEGVQLSYGWYDLRATTFSYLINLLAERRFHMMEHWQQIFHGLNRMNLNFTISLPLSINRDYFEGVQIAELLGSMVTRVDGDLNPPSTRLLIAAFLHPLTICDNIAGRERKGHPTRLGSALEALFDLGAVPIGEE